MAGNEDSKFTSGASSMVAGVFVAKLLGILFVVPLQNLIGGYALGLYQLAYPIYTIMLTLATAGFPIALSKTIGDLSARGQYKEATATYSIIGRFMLLFGLAAAVLLWLLAPLYLSWTLPGASASYRAQALPAVRALAPALLIVPIMSAERGYLQGNQRLHPSALSQVVEQVSRVAFILAGTLLAVWFGFGPSSTAAVATSGAFVGAIASFVLLLASVKKMRKELARRARYSPPPHLRPGRVLQKLFVYSLPVALGTLVFPLSTLIDALTVQRQLVAGGASELRATIEYGIYTGEAMRLMQVPLSFATAIGAAILPAITGAVAVGDRKIARSRMIVALRMTAFVTLPAVAALFLLAKPLNIALFTSSGSQIISITSIMAVFSALELVSTYILQGYDRFYRPVAHMLIGAAIRLVLNLSLIPTLGIPGAAVAGIAGYIASSWLNMRAVRRVSQVDVSFLGTSWRAIAATAIVGIWFYAVDRLYAAVPALHPRPLALLTVLLAIAVGVPVYLGAALWMKAADRQELAGLPLLGRYFRS